MSHHTPRPWSRPRGVALLALVALLSSLLTTLLPSSLAGAAPVATADDRAPSLLTALPGAAARADAGDESVRRSRLVEVDASLLPARASGQRVRFNLFEDADFVGTVERRERTRDAVSWSGSLDVRHGSFHVVQVGHTRLVHVSSPEGTFQVEQVEGDTYRVAELAPPGHEGDDAARDFPGAGKPVIAPRETRAALKAGLVGKGDAGDLVDVYILYTAGAVAAAGGQAGLDAQIVLAINQTNSGFANSGVTTRVRLVGTGSTASAETGGSLLTDLTRVRTPGDGFFDEAQGARETTHADLVSLWIGGTPAGTCGRGYLGGGEAYGYTATFVTSCATANLTFAHEVGHNFGADHNIGAAAPPTTTIPYAHGYVDPANQFYTVMAYPSTTCQPPSCARLANFSNPGVPYNGRPTGDDAAQNARLINEAAPALSAYRLSQIYPGAVGITGNPRVGGTLKAVTGTWAPAVTFGFQWYVDGVPLPGATGPEFKLTRAQKDSVITLLVTGVAPTYNPASAGTAGTPPIAKGKFKAPKPKVKGKKVVGSRLKASIKKWKPNPTKVKYRWLRNGKAIKGATGKTYRPTRRDRGDKIQVKVIAKKPGYAKKSKKSKKFRIRGR